MVQRKSVFPMLQANPTRVWDTFAEPNNLNNTEWSFYTKSGLITPFGVTSPKKQVNRGRLRMKAAQNLSYGVQKHLTKSSGLFFVPSLGLRVSRPKLFISSDLLHKICKI